VRYKSIEFNYFTRGMGFTSQANQISHTLPTTRHRCKLDAWALEQSRRVGHHPLMTPKRVFIKWVY